MHDFMLPLQYEGIPSARGLQKKVLAEGLKPRLVLSKVSGEGVHVYCCDF